MVAMWVPPRTRTYSVACAAVRVRRGSMTMKFARLSSLPSSTCSSDIGCASGPFAVHLFHRIFQPAVAVHELTHRSALGAVRAAVDRTIPARLLADPHAVRHFGGDRAADRAMRADVLAQDDFRAHGGGRASCGLSHRAEGQGAQCGEAARDAARAAPKNPPRKPAPW